MIEKMIERINKEIKQAKFNFEFSNEYSPIDNARIGGMIELLNCVSGKKYYYDENGLHEQL